jgi:hypothetical protein
MKYSKSYLNNLPLVLVATGLAACTGQAATGSLVDSSSASAPGSSSAWELMIPVLVPVIIAAVKWALPKVPAVALPILAPVLGAAMEIVLHFAGVSGSNGVLGAVLGAAGVGLREVIDQIKKLQTEGQ